MILFSDITMHGFQLTQAAAMALVKHFASIKKIEGAKPEWAIEHKYVGDTREESLIKIIQNVKRGGNWFQRVRFDGRVSSPKEISWLLKAVGMLQ